MLVPLAELKRALGIPEADVSQDTYITELEARAAAWVQEQTHRYFGPPVERVELVKGSRRGRLFITGHMAGPAEEDDDFVYATMRERTPGSEWAAYTNFERYNDSFFTADGAWWDPTKMYEVTYMDGYHAVPADIKALIIELVILEQSKDSEESGITSEKIGDYSYTVGGEATVGVTGLSGTGYSTLHRWRRRLI